MKNNKNIPYYFLAIVISILLKFGFRFAENDDLIFLLKPTNKFIELLTGSNSIYISNKGFFYNQLNIYIDKSCAGFNFWVLSFLMLTFLGLNKLNNHFQKMLTIPLALTGAYFFTIFANVSRIYASIVIQNQTNSYFESQQHLIHESIGIITYLSILIIMYFLANKILTNKIFYAKLT